MSKRRLPRQLSASSSTSISGDGKRSSSSSTLSRPRSSLAVDHDDNDVDEAGPSNKVARVSDGNNGKERRRGRGVGLGNGLEEEDVDDDEEGSLRWRREAGMILKVQLRNFMCHQNFTYEPNTRLNFLCGANGSGKSAVLTAIVFALGASARTSSRGTSNKGFIRTGQQQTSVEIQLWNGGDQSFRPDIYGKTITVVRTVTAAGGGSYKIKAESGKVVQHRKVKEELDKMLTAFGIQVDNPIAVLNQDTAKSFLYKCDPPKLYDFFMKATQLEVCKNDYESAAEEKNCAEATFREKKDNLPKLKEEEERWNKKLQLLQSFKDREKKLNQKRNDFAWALVIKAEFVLRSEQKARQMLEAKVDKCREGTEKETRAEKKLRERKVELEREIQAIAAAATVASSGIGVLKGKYQVARDEEKSISRRLGTIANEEGPRKKNLDMLKTEIDRLKQTGDSEYEKGRKKRDDDISKLDETVAAMTSQLRSQQVHDLNLSSSLEEARNRLRASQGNLNSLKAKMVQKQSELKTLDGQKERLVVFGEKMPRLVAAIRAAKEGVFRRTPIGPIGAEMSLVPAATKEQALVIEAELGKMLNNFIVDSFEDKRALDEIQAACGTCYPIIILKFCTSKYDIERGRCRHPQLPTVYDLLVLQNPVVSNCLVDQTSIEQILVVPGEAMAQQLFSRKGQAPANCTKGLTHNYSEYYPAPNYRTYSMNMRNTRGVLRASVEEMAAAIKKDVLDINSQLKEEKKAYDEQDQSLSRISAEKSTCESNLAKIKEKIKSTHLRLGQLKTEAETAKPPNVTALEEDWDKMTEELEALHKRRTEAEGALGLAKRDTAKAKAEWERGEEEVRGRASTSEPLSEELDGIEAKVHKCEEQKSYYHNKLADYADRVKAVMVKEKDADKVRAERQLLAEQRSPERLEPGKSPETIYREITSLEESMKRREEIEESFEQVTTRLEEIHEKYESVKKQVQQVQSRIAFLHSMLSRRESGFAELRKSISRRVRTHFSTYLHTRKFSGELKFNHLEQTLEISVSPEGGTVKEGQQRSMKTLSGGEKSYSTISLILALWDVMNPPFRVLDEFDVFMDMVNRRTALNQVTDYAREARKYQYVFLTPLDTEGLKIDGDIKILKLEKNQG